MTLAMYACVALLLVSFLFLWLTNELLYDVNGSSYELWGDFIATAIVKHWETWNDSIP